MTPNSLLVTSSRVKIKSTAAVFTLLVIFTFILSACGGGSTQNNQAHNKHILKIATQSYDFPQAGFYPYHRHPTASIPGLLSYTLYFCNMNHASFPPILAT